MCSINVNKSIEAWTSISKEIEKRYLGASLANQPLHLQRKGLTWDNSMIKVIVEFVSRSESQNTVTIAGCVNTVDTEGN